MVLRAALPALAIALAVAGLSACSSFDERDQFQDKRNQMKRDVLACGSDTACIERAERKHAPKTAEKK